MVALIRCSNGKLSSAKSVRISHENVELYRMPPICAILINRVPASCQVLSRCRRSDFNAVSRDINSKLHTPNSKLNSSLHSCYMLSAFRLDVKEATYGLHSL